MGDTSAVFGVDLVEHQDGPERGLRVLRFRTGGGLVFESMVDRAMDVGTAELHGIGQALADDVEHRSLITIGTAKVAMNNALQPTQILSRQRPAQPELIADLFDLGRIKLIQGTAVQRVAQVTMRQLERAKRDQREQEQEHTCVEQSRYDEARDRVTSYAPQ